MKKITLFILLLITINPLFAQKNNLVKNIDVHDYIQLRASSNFEDNTPFMIRRLKFWIKSKPEFSIHWSYKTQALITSWMQEKFFLQDAKIGYKTRLFSFDFRQSILQYSLQWAQPDYLVPSIERVIVVNALHTDGTIGVRDIGVQANFIIKNKLLEIYLGFFNGYAIKEYRFANKGFMISHKIALNIPVKDNKFQLGYSLQYRKAENLVITKVLPDTVLFTGKDLRYNLFILFKSRLFEMQVEYLTADFDDRDANGYYFLSAVNIYKNQIVLGIEDYKDLIDRTSSKRYYHLGCYYYINDYKAKLSLDNYSWINDGRAENYYASVQLQIFII